MSLFTPNIINEKQIKRSELKDSDFGIPEDRKYPLDSEEHVRSAIKLFGHAEESKKKILAHRINIAAKKYGIDIPETTQCYKYLHESYILESKDYLLESPITNNQMNITFSKSFNDVKNIVDTLSKKELSNICSGTFKDSPYVIYREVLLLNDDPAAFIDVYNIDNESNKDIDGCIVIACKSKYRGLGLSTTLFNRMKKYKSFKWNHLIWETKKDNNASISLAKKLKLSETNRNKSNIEFSIYRESTNIFGESISEEYYRVTYNDIGIYQALKSELTKTEEGRKIWRHFINSEEWLPVPPNYKDYNKSYFTKVGYNKFIESNDYKLMKKYLDNDSIKIDKLNKLDGKLCYKDKYQVVTESSYNYFITNELHDEEYNTARYIQMIMFQELDAYMVGNHIHPVDIDQYDDGYKIAEFTHDNDFLEDHVWNFIKHVSNMIDNSVLNKYEIILLDDHIIGVRVCPGKESVELDINAICANFGWTNNDLSFEQIDESVLNEVATGTKVPLKYKIYYGSIELDKKVIPTKRNTFNRMEVEGSLSFREAVINCINTPSDNISVKRSNKELDIFIDKKNFDLSNDCVIYELENDGKWFYKHNKDYSVYRRDSNAKVVDEFEFDSAEEAIRFVGGINLYDMKTKMPLNYLLEEDDQLVKSDNDNNYCIIQQDPSNNIYSVPYQMKIEFNITRDQMKKAEDYQNRNPELVIFTCKTCTREELDKLFNKFKGLSEKQRKLSNRLCLSSYGYNMYDMYNKLVVVTNKISKTKVQDLEPDVVELISTNVNQTLQEYMDYIKEMSESYGRDKSLIAEMLLDIYNADDLTFTESVIVKRFINETIEKLECIDYDVDVEMCPYFTPEKMISMGVFNDDAKDNFYKVYSNYKYKSWFESYCENREVDSEWYNTLQEEYNNLLKNPTPENYQTVLELGWNPELYPSLNTILKSSDITKSEIFEGRDITNIDLTKMKWSDNILSEDVNNNDLIPIYIITTYTETPFGKIIRKVTDSRYTHASISFDTSLENMYSFNFKEEGKFMGGLSFESIKSYLEYNPNSIIKVQAIFVKTNDMVKIKNKLDEYIVNYKNTRYNVMHCIDIVLNKARKGKDFAMICSEFVSSLLRVADIDLVPNKSANIITPKDLSNTFNNKVYLVYEGLLDNYDPNKADTLVKRLQKRAKYIKECNFNDPIISKLQVYLLQDITPVMEAKVEFDDAGDLIISDFKKIDFESEYHHSNKLLKVYKNNENYEGMKNELAKLWYLNSLLENKLYGTKFNKFFTKSDLDKYNKTRSKILNLFDNYLKMVTKNDKSFDFQSYYQETPYYTNSVTIKKSTINGIIDTMKRFIR